MPGISATQAHHLLTAICFLTFGCCEANPENTHCGLCDAFKIAADTLLRLAISILHDLCLVELPPRGLSLLQGSLASADGTTYNEATLAYANISEATLMWQQQLDRFAIDNSGTVYESLPEGGKLASVVKEVLDIVPEGGAEEQVQFVARKVFYHMFEIGPSR